MRLFTIGFTKKSAEVFFELLRASGAVRLVDVRLNNSSQLAGFAKREDLAYLLDRVCGMEYAHVLDLAPTAEMLQAYRKHQVPWVEYESQFVDLMMSRRVETIVSRTLLDNSVLLCSEETPEHCHRRLVAEYLASHWEGLRITHLVHPPANDLHEHLK